MHEVIRKELQTLMQSADHKASSVDKLIETLKASEVIKKLVLSDEDFVEVKKDIEMIKSLSPSPAPSPSPSPTPRSSIPHPHLLRLHLPQTPTRVTRRSSLNFSSQLLAWLKR